MNDNIRNSTPIKIEYFNPLDGRRVVSHSYRPFAQHPIINYNSATTDIQENAIKTEQQIKQESREEVVLVNGCWDTTAGIPNIVAEMHVNAKDIGGVHSITMRGEDPMATDSPRDGAVPSPRGSDSGIESDCTEGNLSWLLNYKIQELPPVPDATILDNDHRNVHRNNQENLKHLATFQQSTVVHVPSIATKIPETNQDYLYKYSDLKKPPFTYTELIEYALSERGELTVSGIYQWISEHFPFYKQNDDRWKNSVRHNLSINPHFRKGGKAVQGAGHLWTIAQKNHKRCSQIKQRIRQFFQNSNTNVIKPLDNIEKELQAATESILEEIHGQRYISAPRTTNIEVEYINLGEQNNGLEDFLAPPVSKQDIVNECGLGNDIFVTDINPNTLGLNLVESEGMAENYDVFEYYTAKE